MREEALTQRYERLLNTAPQVLASARAFLSTRVAPAFECTFGGWLAFSA